MTNYINISAVQAHTMLPRNILAGSDISALSLISEAVIYQQTPHLVLNP